MYKLLLVDDEPIIIKGIRSFVDFNALSISQVFEASNGEMALELFIKHEPDLVLADINMPKMNGLDFAIAAKAIKPDVKIALVTGYDYFDYALTALKNGIDDYVLKPVSRSDIEDTLKKLIQKVHVDEKNSEVSTLVANLIRTSSPSDDPGYKSKIQNEINQNFSNPDFSLNYLAEKLSLNPSYLSTLFKTLYDSTFQDYMLSFRLNRAKILLLSTDMKIYEIASAVGFEDPNYFSTAFKKKFMLSPNQFKEKNKL
ncbi:response regulator transcription factor [Sporosarcina sp. CAU 1771]